MTKEDITPERVVKAISDATGKIQAGTLLIDLEETAAWLNGRPLEIEPQAFALLVVMARKPGHWFDYMDFTRIIDGQIFEMAEASRKWRTHMHRLRTALQEANNGTEYLRNKTGERKRAYFSIRP
jgi:DNA-binding response OmpR family regulator